MTKLKRESSQKEPAVILITGGSGSGKSEFTRWFKHAVVIELDSFYKPKDQVPKDKEWGYNFDHPNAVDIEECAETIKKLLKKKKAMVPRYDMILSERVGKREVKLTKKVQFIIVEGIFTFYSPLRELADIKIFLDTPTEIRVARRMIRDVKRKGRTKLEIMSNFVHAERNYYKHIEPMKKFADVIIPFSFNPIQLKRRYK
ncbi:hypothetical protein A3A46_04305 [Candidatus Roizmanbacteria bacterium RIFCSPLOWO2_01_FULL_37_13]|uniref:Phosphoribulokinase/uridine kinase domain-containing protein n=1 Tax=Candidatus Roizmanbacteria bacterium RIFCSPHIGHO2_02_FULL_38_11 TaxID=1802039 RepID=A0A1F7H1M8_9BACT|nr:MAG: hypothetical protein A3C25_03130 [Candidatus Roizmanbacteria bacterium RIFCSPHIGHO2_02_FULL_38_11]OGK40997.1 MAG: hypothetical protein A3A46_04305 [Candidatus Roizmanbacteria bacterium RIFCSPLOWO2_01_FULL_37_13]